MSRPVFQVLATGLGLTFQDAGRTGWRRFGVPASGAMDDHAAASANQLVGNLPGAPVLELLLQGAKLAVLRDCWIALTGASADSIVPTWKPVKLMRGTALELPHNRIGVWTYLAVAGGFDAPRHLGSASTYARGNIGRAFAIGDILQACDGATSVPESTSASAGEARRYDAPPTLRVWRGPQWDFFNEAVRSAFFSQPWTISSQSDRVGYRLQGAPLAGTPPEILSEPVRAGSIQIPVSGLPIVTMRDGPTVGGYAKLAMVDPADVSWLAQCRPGQAVNFRLIDEA